jgi:hypothetical protein
MKYSILFSILLLLNNGCIKEKIFHTKEPILLFEVELKKKPTSIFDDIKNFNQKILNKDYQSINKEGKLYVYLPLNMKEEKSEFLFYMDKQIDTLVFLYKRKVRYSENNSFFVDVTELKIEKHSFEKIELNITSTINGSDPLFTSGKIYY